MTVPARPSALPPGLARLNALSRADAEAAFHAVCGSKRWASGMAAKRPFETPESLYREAEADWLALSRDDWLEAFSHHPRIGETNLGQPRFTKTAEQSRREQSGMAAATEEVRAAFVVGNADYERTFGHVFLICATGKTGEQMLEQLRVRLGNNPESELRNAANEQAKIIRIRLERLVNT